MTIAFDVVQGGSVRAVAEFASSVEVAIQTVDVVTLGVLTEFLALRDRLPLDLADGQTGIDQSGGANHHGE